MGHLPRMKFLSKVIQIKFISIFKVGDGVKEQTHNRHFKNATKEVNKEEEVLFFTHNQILHNIMRVYFHLKAEIISENGKELSFYIVMDLVIKGPNMSL